jgi:hypothetical protein
LSRFALVYTVLSQLPRFNIQMPEVLSLPQSAAARNMSINQKTQRLPQNAFYRLLPLARACIIIIAQYFKIL